MAYIDMEKDKIKWIFFDIGSTLVDESACEQFRIRLLSAQPGAPDTASIKVMISERARKLQPPYKQVSGELHLNIAPWPQHLEALYPYVHSVLEYLHGKYHLGIIANQDLGTEKRLTAFGIRRYFDIIAASAELGIATPDPEIFLHALDMAGCCPEEAAMIGDRLDNDIAPAAALGIKTVWVRQGMYADADIGLIPYKPDLIIDSISELKNHF